MAEIRHKGTVRKMKNRWRSRLDRAAEREAGRTGKGGSSRAAEYGYIQGTPGGKCDYSRATQGRWEFRQGVPSSQAPSMRDFILMAAKGVRYILNQPPQNWAKHLIYFIDRAGQIALSRESDSDFGAEANSYSRIYLGAKIHRRSEDS